jgi:hypothetical protein
MMQLGLVGLGAGAAAALLFASATAGSWLSIILFYLAPLPIMIAGLGWSHWAAMVAALSGALAVGVVFGSTLFFAFLAGAGIPAWWLSYLALLARPVTAGLMTTGPGTVPAPANDSLEWYPPGRLVVWAAMLAALVVVVAIPNFGMDAESFRAALTKALSRMFQINSETPGTDNSERLIAFLVTTIPPAAAVLATITNVLNLWLAGRIVNFSGLLKRPWPDLSAITFPRLLIGVLAAAMVVSFTGGLIGIVGGVLTSSLMMAYSVLGFAVVHSITQGMTTRPFLLGGIYASVFVFGWPVLVLCLLGIAEGPLNLRARAARKRGVLPPRT